MMQFSLRFIDIKMDDGIVTAREVALHSGERGEEIATFWLADDEAMALNKALDDLAVYQYEETT